MAISSYAQYHYYTLLLTTHTCDLHFFCTLITNTVISGQIKIHFRLFRVTMYARTQSFTFLLTEHRIATRSSVSLQTSLPFSDRWTVKARLVIHAALISRTYCAPTLFILSDLAVSVAFTCMDCHLIVSIPFEAYLMKWMTVASTLGCVMSTAL